MSIGDESEAEPERAVVLAMIDRQIIILTECLREIDRLDLSYAAIRLNDTIESLRNERAKLESLR